MPSTFKDRWVRDLVEVGALLTAFCMALWAMTGCVGTVPVERRPPVPPELAVEKMVVTDNTPLHPLFAEAPPLANVELVWNYDPTVTNVGFVVYETPSLNPMLWTCIGTTLQDFFLVTNNGTWAYFTVAASNTTTHVVSWQP